MAKLEYIVVLHSPHSLRLEEAYTWCYQCWPNTRGATYYAGPIYAGFVRCFSRRFMFQFHKDAIMFHLTWGGTLFFP